MWENRTFTAKNRKFRSLVAVAAVVATTAALGVVVQTSPAQARQGVPAAGTRVTTRWVGAVNTRSMAAVNQAYWARYAPKYSLPINWLGGSILGCLPGLSSVTSNAATLSAINYVRSLAGLAPVRFSLDLNARAQRAALMMDANDTLDHHPGRGWRCWSQTGADAASKSNLALAWPELTSGQIVDMYMDDKGDSNTAAGHRRWILNPFSTVMGNGSTSTANALTVIGPTSSSRPNPRFVPWPTAGYFPSTLEPSGRWSLSAGLRNVDFGSARVAVYRNGNRVTATKYPVHVGYAQPTVVFQLGANVPRSGNFRVVVSNIKRPGVRAATYTYDVRLFTPYR